MFQKFRLSHICNNYILYFCLQGLPVFIEEGRYKEIETFNIPACPQSIRLVKEDMGSPELYLASSTNYEGMQFKNKIYIYSQPKKDTPTHFYMSIKKWGYLV